GASEDAGDGQGIDGGAGAPRRPRQGFGAIPRRCCSGRQAGGERDGEDQGAGRSARRAVAGHEAGRRAMNVEVGSVQGRSEQGQLHYLSVAEAAHAIAAKELSPVELVKALLARIERLDPKLNAFIRLDGEAALKAAR